jgi:protein SCO1
MSAARSKIARVAAPLSAVGLIAGVLVVARPHVGVGASQAHATAAKISLPLPPFSLTDQRKAPFGLAQLEGRVWIADFVFTSCPTVCPKLTKRMATIQERTQANADAIHLLTISVDPENDTPEVLAKYATRYGADPARWTFLTGPLAAIEGAVMSGFKIAMGTQETAPGSGIITIFHGEKFVLVDRDAHIRGYYDADDEGTESLLRDAAELAKPR